MKDVDVSILVCILFFGELLEILEQVLAGGRNQGAQASAHPSLERLSGLGRETKWLEKEG
ncbi:MAG: hypothetical protein H7222_12845 [Methylotenera sp.]|nr:hypothetical protein [Oligoflexia bacterium]